MQKSEKEEQEYDEALDFLNVDRAEVEKNSRVVVGKDKSLQDKVTRIKNVAISYRMILEGKTFIEEEGAFVQTRPAIAGNHFTSLSYGIVNSFAEDSNLLTQKDLEKFNIQFIDAFVKIEMLSLRDRSICERDQRAILKLFKDTLINIGDVITGSKENMEKVFAKISDANRDDGLFGPQGF